MSITPTGPEQTITRKQLLAHRDAEAKRLREEWAKEKENADDKPTG